MVDRTGFHPLRGLTGFARQSPWVLIALALHLIVIAGAAVLYTAHQTPPAVDEGICVIPTSQAPPEEPAPPPPERMSRAIPDEPDPELVDLPEVYIPDELARTDEPLGMEDAPDERTEIPEADTAIGVGRIGRSGNPPTPFDGRGKNLRLGPGTPDGGDPSGDVYEATLSGLRWLARHQNPDGSWSAATLREVCPCDDPAYAPPRANARAFDAGLTSLALLAFLGAGYSHESVHWIRDDVTGERHRTGDVVKAGLKWLVANQNDDGSFTPRQAFLYNEALAAMALSEAFGLTQARYWRAPAQRALDFVQAAQRPSPLGEGLWGWRYAARADVERFHRGAGSTDPALARDLHDADTSVTGWCVMALKSGELSGLSVARQSFDGALDFARFVTQVGPDGKPTGLAGYLDARGAGAKVTGPGDHFAYHPASMSALAMCIRIFGARDAEDPFLRPAAERIVQDLPATGADGLQVDYYYWYYASLALNQVDGPDAPRRSGRFWPTWNRALVEALTKLQARETRDCTEGGWMAPDRWGLEHGGPLYATALNTLTLEVYYRYENAFGGRKRN
jgi:hypothetical protein